MLDEPKTKWVRDQWPDNLCSGFITFTPSDQHWNQGGFILRDASHGIPVFGSIRAETFNYPGQTEEITRRLVACWNAFVDTPIKEIEAIATENASLRRS